MMNNCIVAMQLFITIFGEDVCEVFIFILKTTS